MAAFHPHRHVDHVSAAPLPSPLSLSISSLLHPQSHPHHTSSLLPPSKLPLTALHGIPVRAAASLAGAASLLLFPTIVRHCPPRHLPPSSIFVCHTAPKKQSPPRQPAAPPHCPPRHLRPFSVSVRHVAPVLLHCPCKPHHAGSHQGYPLPSDNPSPFPSPAKQPPPWPPASIANTNLLKCLNVYCHCMCMYMAMVNRISPGLESEFAVVMGLIFYRKKCIMSQVYMY